MLLVPIIVFLVCFLLATQLYVFSRFFIWYGLVEPMPNPVLMELMRQDVIARYTTLVLAQWITAIRQRATK